MGDQVLMQLLSETAKVTFMMAGPLLAAALVVGLTISIFQVVTSIQDITLTFAPRIVAVFTIVLILLPWMIERITSFTIRIFGQFGTFSQ
jgi:flagellar biosynthetic protein FliQ